MLSLLQATCIELVDVGKHKARVANRIDTDIPSAAVRRASGELDLRPHKSTMRRTDSESSRLSENCVFGTNSAVEQCTHAEAFVFLIGYGGNDDLSRRCLSCLS